LPLEPVRELSLVYPATRGSMTGAAIGLDPLIHDTLCQCQ